VIQGRTVVLCGRIKNQANFARFRGRLNTVMRQYSFLADWNRSRWRWDGMAKRDVFFNDSSVTFARMLDLFKNFAPANEYAEALLLDCWVNLYFYFTA
jgi:hypothetical protein